MNGSLFLGGKTNLGSIGCTFQAKKVNNRFPPMDTCEGSMLVVGKVMNNDSF